jgi:hypothetical protein
MSAYFSLLDDTDATVRLELSDEDREMQLRAARVAFLAHEIESLDRKLAQRQPPEFRAELEAARDRMLDEQVAIVDEMRKARRARAAAERILTL